ncbi:porin [Bordetella pseudohinzii]|uniref:Outer membrane porin protein BP0840 n=1 Tax=Bordetella pseudohinzii TaxID=1331258 RepID=A0A0J6EV73_9BORD|nr:porin [Bordetella pseudohinzii]ANY15270.1 hypothetical protein BBN53_04805 [Bordetella pseudohinzii]KMM24345.1 hypothetical protein L540_07060 [Bordetella pseudohinzii]KXA75646.1 hypothetical protein AW877_19375 [Bordetella pseudohinzii]KXA76059.1 hypothetical protein AW878_18960 [Bordetella pseudohinzii]CUI49027.1 Outer membrane porin protein BP0840 precursor [Bordetella pseudohinzii]
MKKTFAAVLAAVVCPAAMAQSSLTLSGVMDMGMSYRSGDAQSRISTRSGGQSVSRWTLRGSEDLGGGMTAFFNLTNVFNAGTGKSAFDGRLFNGAAYVGLRASAGELRLGRQAVFGGAWGSLDAGFDGGWAGAGDLVMPAGHGDVGPSAIVDKLVSYRSPALGPFKLGLGYSFGVYEAAEAKDVRRDHLYTAGLRYEEGPWSAGLTVDGLLPRDAETRRRTRNHQATLAYQQDRFGASLGLAWLVNANRGPVADLRHYSAIAAGMHVGLGAASTLRLAVQRAAALDFYSLAAGYQYDLSKRSNLYSYVIHRHGGPFGRQIWTAGLRHRF